MRNGTDAAQTAAPDASSAPPGQSIGAAAAGSRSAGRLGWVDIARALAMLAVIFGHVGTESVGAGYTQDGAYGLITMIINPVKLPIFFALSGYLYSHRYDDPAQLARRTLRARLIPYAFWGSFMGLVATAMDLMRCGFDFGRLPSLLLSNYILPLLRGNLIWFIPCLTVLELIFALLLRLSRKRMPPLILLTALCTTLGYIISSRGEIMPWKFDTALTSTQFMTLGYLLRRLSDRMRNSADMPKMVKNVDYVENAANEIAQSGAAREIVSGTAAPNGGAKSLPYRIMSALHDLHPGIRAAIYTALYAALLASFNLVWRGCTVNMNLGGYFHPVLFTVLSFVGILAVFAISELIGSSRVLCFIGRNTFVFFVWHMYAAKAGLALLGLLPHSSALPMTAAVLIVTVFSAAVAALVSAAVNRFIPFSVGRPRGVNNKRDVNKERGAEKGSKKG